MDGTLPLRDQYGLEINRDYADLLQTYQPLWIKSALEQQKEWRELLTAAASQLGLHASEEGLINLHDASIGDIIDSALRELAHAPNRGERHADLHAQLLKAVSGGVPNDLRPNVWPVLLDARRHCPVGRYSKLVQLQKGGYYLCTVWACTFDFAIVAPLFPLASRLLCNLQGR